MYVKRFNLEFSVGLLVLGGLLSTAYLAIRLGNLDLFGGDSYLLEANFQNVSGLAEGSRIEISGVAVGQVQSISLNLEEQVAVVWLRINRAIRLGDDVIASVKTSGLIGDKYIKLSPGGSNELLSEGDVIEETESAVDLEELISKYVFGGV